MNEKTNADDKKVMHLLAGQYLTFRLDGETYGLQLLKVREIIGLMQITKVPKSPEYIRGVINLRGTILPVIELRKKFSLNVAEDTKETCIIVVEVKKNDKMMLMGILVDSVSEVVAISSENIDDNPTLTEGLKTDYILGMAKLKNNESVFILLNIEKVLVDVEVEPETAANIKGDVE